jgi:2-dehydro-3-deoxyphosphogalactonate aldolase
MSTMKSFVAAQLDKLPLVAILRGLKPSEALDIGSALYDSGIQVMEVTLNSPEPLKSIELLANRFDGKMAIGAGTVLSAENVTKVREAGGQLIVSPNVDVEVISRTVELGMHSLPGAMTCTECFQAIKAGADGLKIFPASVMGVPGVKDLVAVIPKEMDIFAVGGVTDANMADWLRIGIKGVGLGSNLYCAGDTPAETAVKAKRMIEAFKAGQAA